MAKTKKFETLDEFGFESDLNMPDFDFQPDKPEKKSSRKAALDLGKAAIKGAGSGLKDEMFIRRTIKSTLPRGYGSALDLADEATSTLKSLYNDSVKEVKPMINDLQRVTKKIQPSIDKYLPSGISKRLAKFAAGADRAAQEAMDAEAAREASLQAQLAEVFQHQIKSQAQRDATEDARSRIREGIDQTRHKDSMGQLAAIRIATQQLAAYQNNIGVNFQRKSLELQYRSFFIARDMLEEVKKQGAVQMTAFEKLVRNTGLPDYVKMTEAENIKQIMRNKFIDQLDNSIFAGRREFLQKFGQGVRKAVGQRVSDFAQNFRYGLDSAENVTDALQMQKEFAEMGIDTGGAGGMAAGIGGSIVAQSLAARLGKRAKKEFVTRFPKAAERGRRIGNKITYNVNNLPSNAQRWAEGFEDLPGVPRVISDFIRDTILNMPGQDRTLERDSLKDMQKPAPFSRQVSKSITEIIPGYLARILREISILRTGNEATPLVQYDFLSNKFSTKADVAKNAFNSVIDKSGSKWLGEDLDKLIDHIEGDEKKLTAEQRQALKRQLLMDNLRKRGGRVEPYMDYLSYTDKEARKHADVFSQLFQERFQSDPEHANRVKFSDLHNPIGSNIRVAKAAIQDMQNAGMQEFLQEAGLIDAYGNINEEKIYEYHLDPNSANVHPAAKQVLRRASRRRGESRPTGAQSRRFAPSSAPMMSTVPWQSAAEHPKVEPELARHPQAQQFDSSGVIAAIEKHSSVSLLDKANETLLRIEDELKKGLIVYGGGDIDPSTMPPGGPQGPRGPGGRKWFDRTLREHWGRAKDQSKSFGRRALDWWKEPGWGSKQWNRRSEFWQGAKDKVSGWYKQAKDKIQEMTDVYVKGEAMPRLTAWGMKAGKYRDAVTGQVIKSYKDIKGAVVDENGNVVLTLEQAKDAFSRTTVGKKIVEIGKWIKDKAIQGFKLSQSVYGMAWNTAKEYAQKGMDYLNAQDVYVKGEYESPVLQATVMRAKGYKSQARPDKYILSPADIDGAVINLQGDVVLSNDQIKQGLVDKHGRPLVSGKLRLLQLGKDTIQYAINKVQNGFRMAKDWLSGKWRGFADWFKVDGIAFSGGKTIIERLTEIRDILDTRLPGRKKKVLGDVDGDGIREGSYEDKKRKGQLHNVIGGAADAAKDAAAKLKGHGESLYGFLGGKAMGLLGWLKNRKKGAAGEAGEEGGSTASNALTALDIASNLGLGKLGRLGWRGLKGLGRLGLRGVRGAAGLAGRGVAAAGGLAGAGAAGAGGAAEIAAAAQAAGVPAGEAAALAADAVAGGSAGLGLLAKLKSLGWRGLGGRAMSTVATGGRLGLGALRAGGAAMTAAQTAGARGLGSLAWQGLKGGASLLGRGAMAAGRFAVPALAESTVAGAAGLGSGLLSAGAGALNLGLTGVGMLGEGLLGLGGAVVGAVGWPVLLAGAGLAALGYGAYKLYQYSQRKSLTPLSKLRVIQYGFAPDDDSHASAVFQLEDALEKNVEFKGGTPVISTKGLKAEDLLGPFGVDQKDKKAVENWTVWFVKRFKPVFIVHMAALKKVQPDLKLAQVEKLKPSQKKSFVSIAKYPGGPYTVMTSPFSGADLLTQGPDEVKAYADKLEQDIDEEVKKNPDGDKKDEKPAAKTVAQVTAAATVAQALGRPKDSQSADFTSLKQGQDGSTGTGLSAAGAMITMAGTFDAGNLVSGTKLDALSAIRFKTYGLRDMNITRVKALLQLENLVQKDIKLDSNKVAAWTGNLQKAIAVMGPAFGISDPNSNEGYSWINWYRNRFLPTYLNYITALVKATNKEDPKAAVLSLKQQDSLDVAEAIRTSHAPNGAGSVWSVTASPWPNYDVNTDVTTTDENVNGLKTLAVKTDLDQQRAAEGAGKTEKGTGPNAKSESNPSMLSRAWKSLTTNADGSKNWLGRAADTVSQTYDKVTTAVGNAYESAKTTIAGSKVGKAISASAKVIKEKLLAALKAAGISSPTEVAMFMSQMDVESGGFKALSENLNYKPDRLASVFPKYFRGAADAAQVAAGGPEAIANRVYGGRMGNTDPGDGYRYRGRGVIQLTGKANYERYGKLIGVDLVNNPDLAADPDIAAKIAIAYWKDRNVSGPAQQGDVRAVTYKINGGQNGLADRQAKYQEYLSQAKLGQLGGGEQLTSNDAGAKGPGGAPAPGAAPPGAAAGSTGNNGLDAGALPKAGAAPSGGAGTMPQTAFDQVQGPGKPALPTPSAAPAAAGAGAAAKQTDPFSAPDLGPSAAMGTGFSPAAARQATDLGSTRQAQQKAQQDAMGGVVDVLTASHGVQVNMLAALQTIAKAVTDGAALQAKSANDNSSSNADAVRNARQASKIPTPMAQNLVSVAKPVFTA